MRFIGQGGGGPDQSAPECPVCYAYGGGGHGGYCPNASRPLDQWVTDPPPGWERPLRWEHYTDETGYG